MGLEVLTALECWSGVAGKMTGALLREVQARQAAVEQEGMRLCH